MSRSIKSKNIKTKKKLNTHGENDIEENKNNNLIPKKKNATAG